VTRALARRLDALTTVYRRADDPPAWLLDMEAAAAEPPELVPLERAANQMGLRRAIAAGGPVPDGRPGDDAWKARVDAELAELWALMEQRGPDAGLAAWLAAGSTLPELAGWPIDLGRGFADDLERARRRQRDMAEGAAMFRARHAATGRWGW
jgi:hypothetical protein